MMGEAKRKTEAATHGVREACGACRFFRRIEIGNPMGHCRGATPTLVMVGLAARPNNQEPLPVTRTYWPAIPDTEWCGVFERSAGFAGIDMSLLNTAAIEGTA
jgi:hypothetical protein